MGCNKSDLRNTYMVKDVHLIVRVSCDEPCQDTAKYHERSPIKDIDSYLPCGVFSDDPVKRYYIPQWIQRRKW